MRRFEDEFSRRRTRILLISFADERWGRAFLEETETPFSLLLDPQLEVYRAYGLGRSALRSYSPSTIWTYLKAMATGRKVRMTPQGDPHQMGGDFLVGADRRLILARPSRTPADRPDVAQLLAALDSDSQGAAPSAG